MNGTKTSLAGQQSRQKIRWQYGIAAVVLIAGLLLSSFFFWERRGREFQRAQQDFQQASRNRIAALKKVQEIDILAIKSVKFFYEGSQLVERDEFKTFMTPLIENNSSIIYLEWIPYVKDLRRAEFQKDFKSNGVADLRILESNKESLVEASKREEYYPICFIEPQNTSAIPIGFDLGTIADCLETMHRSRDTGQMAYTPPSLLPEDSQKHTCIRIFLPIYQRNTPVDTLAERRKNLKGFVVGILPVAGMIEESFETLMPAGIDIYIFAGKEPRNDKMLYHHKSREYNPDDFPVTAVKAIQQAKMSLSDDLDFGEQQWTVVCIPSPEFFSARLTWQPWINGIGGLVLTCVLASYLVTIAIRNKKTAELAAQLAIANRLLQNENRDRTRAEETAHRENAKLSAMISGMDEGIIFADADNTIIEINDYFCHFVGKRREEILGKRIEDFHRDECLVRVLSQINIYRKEFVSSPFVLQRPLGDKEVIFRMQPIYRERVYDGVLLNVIDVSELVQARRQAEVASRAKSRFLATMSHEIRTPMAAILGYADLLMEPKIDCSTRNNYLMVVRRNGEHLLNLINDILDLSKIEAGKLIINKQQSSLVSLLADVASMMRPRADQHGNKLSVEYLTELPESIHTDGGRLRQAIVNLVGNAVKFTENGQVRILVSLLREWRNNQPAVKIEVVDTGIGIRAEVLPQLFQPFSQGDVSLTQKYGGTGLGLAISRHIAELLGGELTVQSVFRQGSNFTLIVPTGDLQEIKILKQPSEVSMDHAADQHAAVSKDLLNVRVLLVEDSIDNQELIRIMLAKAGAKVEFADNGRMAVDKALAESFDIILMDINMPEMDGYEATRLLRSSGYDRPILALTANAMTEDKERCLAVGCNDHLSKPIDRSLMVRTIAHYMGKTVTESSSPMSLDEVSTPNDGGIIVSLYAEDPDIVPILGGYISRLDGQVDAMRVALANSQFSDLQRLAHKMKGSGGNYGYPALTDAAKYLEDAAKVQDAESAAQALQQVAALCQAIKAGYENYSQSGASQS